MKRIAIIFENFGNPGQPYLVEWYKRLGTGTEEIGIKAFTDRIFDRKQVDGVTILKPSGLRKLFAYTAFHFCKVLKKGSWPGLPGFYFLKRYRPDLIHLINAQQFDQYLPICNHLGALLVVSFRGYETSVRPKIDKNWLDKLSQIYLRASSLHFVSRFLMDEATVLGAPRDKCKVIYRSVDSTKFKPRTLKRSESDNIQLLAIGRLTWQKGYDYLLEAMQSVLSKNQCKLLIIGDGEEFERLSKKIDELQIAESVRIIRRVNRDEIIDYMHASDIFIQASVSDALPNTLLEASACGLPIIGTKAGGIPEVVVDGSNGILVEAKNGSALASAINRLISDEDLRLVMGNRAKDICRTIFSSQTELRKWSNFYEETLSAD